MSVSCAFVCVLFQHAIFAVEQSVIVVCGGVEIVVRCTQLLDFAASAATGLVSAVVATVRDNNIFHGYLGACFAQMYFVNDEQQFFDTRMRTAGAPQRPSASLRRAYSSAAWLSKRSQVS